LYIVKLAHERHVLQKNENHITKSYILTMESYAVATAQCSYPLVPHPKIEHLAFRMSIAQVSLPRSDISKCNGFCFSEEHKT
jgi:hypothetical protein